MGQNFHDTPIKCRTKQFGYQNVAEEVNFSKSDVEVVQGLAQHVLFGRFHGNHVFFDTSLKLTNCYIAETNRHRRMIEAWIHMFSGIPNPNMMVLNNHLVAIATIFYNAIFVLIFTKSWPYFLFH